MTIRAAVFVDRDGTVIVERGYLGDPAGVELESGAGAALAALQRAGWLLVLVTNQSGVARGYFGEEDVVRVNDALSSLLTAHGVRLDGIYCCFHGPGDRCDCRKPASGLFERAAADLGIAMDRSFVIGDKAADLEAADRIGATGILVTTGHGMAERERAIAAGRTVVSGLGEAASVILAA